MFAALNCSLRSRVTPYWNSTDKMFWQFRHKQCLTAVTNFFIFRGFQYYSVRIQVKIAEHHSKKTKRGGYLRGGGGVPRRYPPPPQTRNRRPFTRSFPCLIRNVPCKRRNRRCFIRNVPSPTCNRRCFIRKIGSPTRNWRCLTRNVACKRWGIGC